MDFLKEFFGSSPVQVIYLAYDTVEWWAPVVLGIIAVRTWTYYARSNFIKKKKKVLLEVRIPRDTFKSPLAMETALIGFHQMGRENNWYKKYVKGAVRPWFSLELVSIEGEIRFFIWTEVDYAPIVKASIYAQYPNIEAYEVSDYTQQIPRHHAKEWTMYGTEFELTGPDSHLIKTYTNYGLDKDPLVQILAFLGSFKKNEQIWIQIVIRAIKGTGKKTAISKLGFDTGIRALYMAKQGAFRKENISRILGVLQSFNSNESNGFKGGLNVTDFDYPWEDFQGIRLAWRKAAIWNAYVRRNYFHPPYKRKWFVLNQEELATIFHFPGRVVETPTFEHIDSKKSEPPANLPI